MVASRTILIEGMTCDHCKNRVERVLNDLPGVSAAVNLKKKIATVHMEQELSSEELRIVIEKAGYEVVEVQ